MLLALEYRLYLLFSLTQAVFAAINSAVSLIPQVEEHKKVH